MTDKDHIHGFQGKSYMERYEDPGFHITQRKKQILHMIGTTNCFRYSKIELSKSQLFHDTVNNLSETRKSSPVDEYFFRAFWASFDKPVKMEAQDKEVRLNIIISREQNNPPKV